MDYINPPEGKDYKWYISGIFPANLGDYIIPTTFQGNRKQPLTSDWSRLGGLLRTVLTDPVASLPNIVFQIPLV